MYYAEAHGYHDEEKQYGYCDLWRFSTAKERDEFVESNADNNSILSKDARERHKDKFRYWAE